MSNNSHRARNQFFRFMLVGGSTVLIDLTFYELLLNWLLPSPSKTISFLCGAFYAYQLNRVWTFKSGTATLNQAARFTLVYATNLCINIWVNALTLAILPSFFQWRLIIAFAIAAATSATFNYLGMKLLVFL